MSEKEFSVKGWNYGTAKFEGACLAFEVGNMPAFEVPIVNASGCTTGKNEVTLEFHQVRLCGALLWGGDKSMIVLIFKCGICYM